MQIVLRITMVIIIITKKTLKNNNDNKANNNNNRKNNCLEYRVKVFENKIKSLQIILYYEYLLCCWYCCFIFKKLRLLFRMDDSVQASSVSLVTVVS